MTREEFLARGETVSRKAQVLDGLHGYFQNHAPRLHRTAELFNLFSGKLGSVLEIGPFYGYLPFVLRPNSSSYTVLEGDDPVVRPLEPLYRVHDIKLEYVDFAQLFGPDPSAPHRLSLPDAAFDTVLCWETMEHFNFNPVKFVRELHRVVKPGGRICVTVPNRASFQSLAGLLLGKGEQFAIDTYYQFENHEMNGRKVFYGFHWREYSPSELGQLFAKGGFQVNACGSFTAFQNASNLGVARRIARGVVKTAANVFPRFGTHAFVTATK
jgi:SAM-dependent methyltransferase